MGASFLIISEVLLAVVLPLLVLYLRSAWPPHITIPCLVSVPLLWYLTYAPLHELSHVAATYLMGGTVTSMKLIPSFWRGEFGRAWITTAGITEQWQQLLMTAFPYILDLISITVGLAILRRTAFGKPYVVGILFMLLCLRPAFDLICETIAFVLDERGDLYYIALAVGSGTIWLLLLLSVTFSAFAMAAVLSRYRGFPEMSSASSAMAPSSQGEQ